jgi:fido (protein-threonine AMPylation protein)
MPIPLAVQRRLLVLQKDFSRLRSGKESLLKALDEKEIAEIVYNSNAIENSTLTLLETEKILFAMEVPRRVSVREVFEAKNLATVIDYVRTKVHTERMSSDVLLELHHMLMHGIDNSIAGRFRKKDEYVRVGAHIAPAPEHIESMLHAALADYEHSSELFSTDAIARYHLDFEHIHPFIDGNGRIGRVLVNFQLLACGYPPIIVRDKEKKNYYLALREFDAHLSTKRMEKIVALALLESLHKRIAYLRGDHIVTLAGYARKQNKKSMTTLINAAKRQTIPAFRERGVWNIGECTNTTQSPHIHPR